MKNTTYIKAISFNLEDVLIDQLEYYTGSKNWSYYWRGNVFVIEASEGIIDLINKNKSKIEFNLK